MVSALRSTADTVKLEISSGVFELGHVLVHMGELWDAEVPGARGYAAYALLAQVGSCQVVFREGVTPGERTVAAQHQPSLQGVDDEARRALTRARVDGRLVIGSPGVTPRSSVGNLSLPPDAVPVSSGTFTLAGSTPAEREALESFEALFRKGTQAYLKHDFATAKEAFEECLGLRPNDRRVLHNLERLRNRNS